MAMEVEESYEPVEEEESIIKHRITESNEEDEDEDLEELWFPAYNGHHDKKQDDEAVNLETDDRQEHNADSEEQTEKEEQPLNQANYFQSSSPTAQDEGNADEPSLEPESVVEQEIETNNTGEEGDEENSEGEKGNEVYGAGGRHLQGLVVEHDTGDEGDEEYSADEKSNKHCCCKSLQDKIKQTYASIYI